MPLPSLRPLGWQVVEHQEHDEARGLVWGAPVVRALHYDDPETLRRRLLQRVAHPMYEARAIPHGVEFLTDPHGRGNQRLRRALTRSRYYAPVPGAPYSPPGPARHS